MNKIVVYQARPDEAAYFKKFGNEFDLDIRYVTQELNAETAIQAQDAEAVTIQGSNKADRATLQALSKVGVKYLALRSAGYNYVDRAAAKEYGIRFSNVTYSPNSVADFTTMLILMCERKAQQILARGAVQDYTLAGIQGREIRNLTVGIIGTGQIGATVARNLSGFGCNIIGYDIYENDNLRDLIEYVSLEKLISTSDVISLHAPLFDSNYHMINRESIAKMKDGVCIVNCGRGLLIDTEALIHGIETGKVGAAGLDVIEDELGIFHEDHRLNVLNNHQLAILKSFPNVIVTPHMAFYTDQAVSDMVEIALKSLNSFMNNGTSQWEIKS
ncbi:D-isomer specific 2-hydroxyacid dehydrogenase family protein [Paenibacillus polymyxa]|uniref:D-isomer specific 2-hydroxyacid dehydrogenase family protein n=1 Tax=Paenibacillus polymyxa TaxID=1406 RepID=UPI0025B725B4|nr:D-isomer specific 2-hydroxyacid dehydrogenase family protein [Paenibacillus polymyxa]MDN4080326.1 D-isomer specific 2-hydroxyacid dehydrogenase family protein [Paenibacillus polymyxa]MDN4105244.1 D-isomer specific 2-hydroxyacid dehydrogenase family protein [Paenibacillus polymyxa]MDN4115463.1 D-isomer specific 2-hydroxyacid dehydrogenase family protein [Paenibacillus polymyxa]